MIFPDFPMSNLLKNVALSNKIEIFVILNNILKNGVKFSFF